MKDYRENMKAHIYYQNDCNLSVLDRVMLMHST